MITTSQTALGFLTESDTVKESRKLRVFENKEYCGYLNEVYPGTITMKSIKLTNPFKFKILT